MPTEAGQSERDDAARLMLWIVDHQRLTALLRGDLRVVNLPADARIIRWTAPYEINGIAFIVWSSTFGPVPPQFALPHFFCRIETAPFETEGPAG